MMEYSLTDKAGKVYQFPSLDTLLRFLKLCGEVDGWVLRIHHM